MMKRRPFLCWTVALVAWESAVLAASYLATALPSHRGKLYGATYEEDPSSWFLMGAMWGHFFAVPITLAVGIVVYGVRSNRVHPNKPPEDGGRPG